MTTLAWTRQALQDFADEILDRQKHHENVLTPFLSVGHFARHLAIFPLTGRPTTVAGFRAFAVPQTDYVLFYTIDVAADRVVIARIRATKNSASLPSISL